MQTKDKFSESYIFDEVKSDSARVSQDELGEILKNENRIKKKASKLNLEKFAKLIRQLTLSLQMLKDFKTKAYTNIPWKTIALIVAAVLYFINPFDLIPDFIPFLGYTDDAVAFAVVFNSAQKDLFEYCKWKGYNTEDYF
jgi:uncharacterized membrane protein YkvA (DUF1232 family)